MNRDVEPWEADVRARLQARGKERPQSKSRQIMILWPEISAALAKGQTLKTIRDWLQESGIVVTYSAFTSYVSRIRRSGNPAKARSLTSFASGTALNSEGRNPVPVEKHESFDIASKAEHSDPLENVRERSANRPGFEYPPGIDEDSLI